MFVREVTEQELISISKSSIISKSMVNSRFFNNRCFVACCSNISIGYNHVHINDCYNGVYVIDDHISWHYVTMLSCRYDNIYQPTVTNYGWIEQLNITESQFRENELILDLPAFKDFLYETEQLFKMKLMLNA